ncbi:MAG: hypothetical protein KF744_12265 [Taibaiella sp.]|nr:hypothetical protein [Taibaiella sp.]
MSADNKKEEAIRTQEEYQAALKKIELLWHAEPESEQAEILDYMVDLVDEYENINTPIEPPSSTEENKF